MAQQQGLYTDIAEHSSTHNIYLQSLATTGIVGLIALCMALLVLPFRLFYRAAQTRFSVVSVVGMVAITAFAVFGLTESWILRAPMISVYLVYLITLVSVVARTQKQAAI